VDTRPLTIGRRGLLAGGAAAAFATGCAPAHPSQATRASGPTQHQPGIVTAPPAAAVFAAFDIRVPDRDALAGLLREISTQVAGAPAEILVSVGASLFDGRYGLGSRRPAALTTMPSFPNDALDPARCHGDLLLQVCAPDATTAQASLAAVERAAGTGLVPRWRVAAFRQDNGIAANGRPTTRNLLGFQEGMSNPDVRDAAAMAQLVWVASGGGEPGWAAGGSYQVIRLVRFATQLWDREPVSTQEAVFGRRRSDGVPLGRDTEPADFTYADDPTGRFVALPTSAAPTHAPQRRLAAGSCVAATPTGTAPTRGWSSSVSSATSVRASRRCSAGSPARHWPSTSCPTAAATSSHSQEQRPTSTWDSAYSPPDQKPIKLRDPGAGEARVREVLAALEAARDRARELAQQAS
jgi:deferrochelatase/peroxidase EfeB